MNLRSTLTGLAALSVGCAETGQSRTSVPFFVAGTDVSEPVVATGDVPVTIERADLAFGPLYLCAGASAGDLCDTARLEWLDSIVVDTTASEPASAGQLLGVTGPVRSWMYDLAISSLLTDNKPHVLNAARELDGASFVLEGRAVVDGIELPFRASVAVQQTSDTELGVPVIRKSTSAPFHRDVGADESGLVVRFDPSEWVRGMDFRAYVTREQCGEGSAAIVCDGTIERSCEQGAEREQRDCADFEQACIPKKGCVDALTIEGESEAYRSLRNALLTRGRPTFEWDYIP